MAYSTKKIISATMTVIIASIVIHKAILEIKKKAFQMALQALEKQIPKKVQLRHIRKFDGFDDGECTTCGNIVSRDCDGTDNFCPDCGQKLDWRGEE